MIYLCNVLFSPLINNVKLCTLKITWFAIHLLSALVVGFVNTSIMAREGDNTRICLRVLDPPPAVTISEAFRLQINLQTTCKAIFLNMLILYHYNFTHGSPLVWFDTDFELR